MVIPKVMSESLEEVYVVDVKRSSSEPKKKNYSYIGMYDELSSSILPLRLGYSGGFSFFKGSISFELL